MGFHFHPEHQGKGFASESVRGLMDALYSQGVEEIECVVHPDNVRSIGLLERLGFVQLEFDSQSHELIYSCCALG